MSLLLLVLVLTGPTPANATRFYNIDNTPFATRTDGPQGVILIDDNRLGLHPAAITAQAVTAQHSVTSLRRAEHTMRLLQMLGLKSPGAQVRFPRMAYHLRNGRLVRPDLTQLQQTNGQLGSPTNEITFQFSGFPDNDEQALRTYLQGAVPKARLIYGPPAFDLTVTVVQDSNVQTIQGGFYDTATNEIHIPPLSGNFPEDTFVLLMLVLGAFHDEVGFYYDAWEQGFIGAAATAIQTTPGVSGAYDPVDPGPFYCLSVYECENQPALGNNTFYPDSGFAGMLVWRIAMARAAWFKCYIEDPQFFANFNQLYYQSYYDSLPGDVPGLKDIATQVVPSVEGMSFYGWYERQCVLDTSIRTGSKLYTWNIPLEQSVALIVEHYLTGPGGDESPRGGQGRTIYWNYDFTLNLYAEEGNVIDVPANGDGAGEGYLIPTFFNIGGPQRVTVQLDLNGLRSLYAYPYGVRGFEPGENDFYGAVLGGPSATISVTGGAGADDIAADRGVWGSSLTGGRLSPMQLEVTVTNPQAQINTRTVNVGWDSYVIFLEGGGQAEVQHTFPAGLMLMSLPIQPTEPNAAQILGVPGDDLLLARWDPAIPPDGCYHIWPDIAPFAPGRGFWLRLLESQAVSITGVLPPEDRDYPVPVELGWNMMGNPRRYAVDLAELKVQVGTEDVISLNDAFNQGYLQPGVFGYSQANGYELVDTLQAFGGYWLRCLTPGGLRLMFPGQTGPATYLGGAGSLIAEESFPARNLSRRGRRSYSGDVQCAVGYSVAEATLAQLQTTWQMPLCASAGGRQSRAYLGVAPQATASIDPRLDLQSPPNFGPYVAPRFVIGPNDDAPACYLTDIRSPDDCRLVWTVQVNSNLDNVPIRLSWPDMSQVPADLHPILIDPTTNRRIYMRTTSGYEIPNEGGGLQRIVRIEMEHHEPATLVVTALAPTRTALALEMPYTLSAPAAVSAQIMNIAGRTIRHMASNSLQPAGQSRLIWNLRNAADRRVPDGMYLVKLVARSPQGQQVTSLRTVNITTSAP